MSQGRDERVEEVLRRVRAIPEGFVTTYGDLCPAAPRFAGAVLREHREPDLRSSASFARTARSPRASASAGCSSTRAYRFAASGWTCGRPGRPRRNEPAQCVSTISTSQCAVCEILLGTLPSTRRAPRMPWLPTTIRSAWHPPHRRTRTPRRSACAGSPGCPSRRAARASARARRRPGSPRRFRGSDWRPRSPARPCPRRHAHGTAAPRLCARARAPARGQLSGL